MGKEIERETGHDEYEIDMKGTIIKIFSTPQPEVSQEEAIKNYDVNNKKNNSGDDGNLEDEEHLKRVKQELLASLKRVAELEKQVFRTSDKEDSDIKNIKYKENEKSKVVNKNNGEVQTPKIKKENQMQLDDKQQEERE